MAVVRLRGPLEQVAGEGTEQGALGGQDTPVGGEDQIDVLPALSGGR
jgi:hypothetical protein